MTTQDKISAIRGAIEQHFDVDISEHTNAWRVSKPRQLFYLLCKLFDTDATYTGIGRTINRAHPIVILGSRVATHDALYDNAHRAVVLDVVNKIDLPRTEAVNELVELLSDKERIAQARIDQARRDAERELERQVPSYRYKKMCERIGVRG